MSELTSSAGKSKRPGEPGRSAGHIGLIVLAPIVGGLVLGLILVLVAFAGAREPLITGGGMLTLFALSRRRADQPQQWMNPSRDMDM